MRMRLSDWRDDGAARLSVRMAAKGSECSTSGGVPGGSACDHCASTRRRSQGATTGSLGSHLRKRGHTRPVSLSVHHALEAALLTALCVACFKP
jgi:hypothetical protein